MKAKAIHKYSLSKKHFFLLMIAPLLVGFAITLISSAHAEWNKKDPHLLPSPLEQGWTQFSSQEPDINKKSAQKKEILKAISR